MIGLISERICEFGLLFVVVLLAFCLGKKVLKCFRKLNCGFLQEFVFGTAVGFGIFSKGSVWFKDSDKMMKYVSKFLGMK